MGFLKHSWLIDLGLGEGYQSSQSHSGCALLLNLTSRVLLFHRNHVLLKGG